MVFDEIRRFGEAEPFQPYELVLVNGEESLGNRRGGIAIAPEGRYFVYPVEPEGHRILRPTDVKPVQAAESTAA